MNNPTYVKNRTDDPQTIVTGTLKHGEKADIIVFSVRFGFFELVCIVTVPPEGETKAPTYVKWKLARPEPTYAEGTPRQDYRPRTHHENHENGHQDDDPGRSY